MSKDLGPKSSLRPPAPEATPIAKRRVKLQASHEHLKLSCHDKVAQVVGGLPWRP